MLRSVSRENRVTWFDPIAAQLSQQFYLLDENEILLAVCSVYKTGYLRIERLMGEENPMHVVDNATPPSSNIFRYWLSPIKEGRRD
jgi:hypothetical protein